MPAIDSNFLMEIGRLIESGDFAEAKKHLDKRDKVFIHKVLKKARQMVRHDIKHGRIIPFEN